MLKEILPIAVPAAEYTLSPKKIDRKTIDKNEKLNLLIDYTKGDETNVIIKIAFSHDDSDYYDLTKATGALDEFTFAVTGKYLISVPFYAPFARVYYKATGMTVSGTLRVLGDS